jgi:ribosomal protein S24E
MKEIEYIFSVSSKCTVCKSKAKLKSFLEASDLSLVKDILSFESEQSKIKILEKKTKESEGVVYTITFSSDSDDEPAKLLKMFRQVICNIKDENQKNVAILELRNDFAKSRSEKLYSNIYTLENSIRKLISKFMLETLGMKWYEATPQDVKNTVKGEYKWNNDCLYHLDFIQLSYFLTIPYADKSGNVIDELKKYIAKDITEEEKKELRLFIPKNNWDRYFNALVDCDSDKFKSNWEKLYEYRCDIAHNRIIPQNEYDECLKKCEEMQKIINDAIRKLDTVEITEEEKKKTAERTLDGVNISLKSTVFPENLLNTISSVRKISRSFQPLVEPINTLSSSFLKSFDGISALSKCFPDSESMVLPNLSGVRINDSIYIKPPEEMNLFKYDVSSLEKTNSEDFDSDVITGNSSNKYTTLDDNTSKDEKDKSSEKK